MLTRLALLALTVSLVLLLSPQPRAYADGHCPSGQSPVHTTSGVICVVVTDPGERGADEGPGTPPAPSTGGAAASHHVGCFKTGGEAVPCSTSLGVWWSGHQCYAKPFDAPPGSPGWQGHTDGSVWACSSCADAVNATNCNVQIVWMPPGDAPAAPAPPDPGQLAVTAMGEIALATAHVHTAPQAPDHTYVRVENWLWVPPAQWATLHKTVTAGATSVTVTARPTRVSWDLGEGTTTCDSPGRAWRSGLGDRARTSCGYTFTSTSDSAPGGVYPISASIGYQVDWTCSGACTTAGGTLGLIDAPAGQGALRVLQRQTVVVQ